MYSNNLAERNIRSTCRSDAASLKSVACNAFRFLTFDPVQTIYYEKDLEDGLSRLISLVNSGQSDTYIMFTNDF